MTSPRAGDSIPLTLPFWVYEDEGRGPSLEVEIFLKLDFRAPDNSIENESIHVRHQYSPMAISRYLESSPLF